MARQETNDGKINVTKHELLRCLTEDGALRTMLPRLVQEVLEAEMVQALGAGQGERSERGFARGKMRRVARGRIPATYSQVLVLKFRLPAFSETARLI